MPAIHGEDFQVIGLVIDPYIKGATNTASMRIITTLHPGFAIIEAKQQIVVTQLFVITNVGTKGGLVVIDKQAEAWSGATNNRVIQVLVLKGEAHYQIAGVAQLPLGPVGDTPAFHILEEVTGDIIRVGLIGVVVKLSLCQ